MGDLGSRIRDERLKRKLTLEILSPKTELSTSFSSQVGRGLAQPSISSLKKIAREFGMSVVDLFPSGSGLKKQVGEIPPLKNNGRSYIEEVLVVRANWRKRLTLPVSYVSYDLFAKSGITLLPHVLSYTPPVEKEILINKSNMLSLSGWLNKKN